MNASYSVTFACYNQVDYTRQCVDSLVRHGFDLGRLVVVDNGSGDATRDYLQTLPLGGRIFNRVNLGCGVAWTQGALAQQAEWTVVMNNDVVVSQHWLDNMVATAQAQGLKVISPAMVEGPLDYDFDAFTRIDGAKMKDVLRRGAVHAVCMAVHRSVWEEIGYFQQVPRLWGYEDTLFFNELDKARIPTGTAGCSWLHHFGSVTLSALKQERGLSAKDGLSARDSYKLLGQSTLRRKWKKFQRRRQEKAWHDQEMAQFGMTLLGQREGGAFRWR
jgi:GT2 family glycosyltransferase